MSARKASARSATISDVARAAAVSRAVAARALGGYGSVSAEARGRIEEAARRLDYRPNQLARTMATGRSGAIGVVVGDIENPFFGLAVRGISDRARESGFDVILSNSGEDVDAERGAVRTLLARRVDGLIVAPAAMREPAHLDDVLGRSCPLVLLDREVPGVLADAALVDNRSAAVLATRLLIAAGHRRIGYVTAAKATDSRYTGAEQIALSTVLHRIEGILEACREAGIGDAERFIRLNAVGAAASQAIIAALLGDVEGPTAIIASDSRIALDVFNTTKALGLTIPRQVSLVTFDDADWTGAISPAVTVVAQPSYRLGREAACMLIDRIGGETVEPRRRILDATLVQRESVAPP